MDLRGFRGSQDALEADQTEVVCGSELCGRGSRTVGVDEGGALRVVESIGEAP